MLQYGSNDTVMNNTCDQNYASGLYLLKVNDGIIVNNSFRFNENVGINMDSSDRNIIENNNCSANFAWGISILLRLSHHNKITNNTCSDNEVGICLDYSNNNNIENNTCANNKMDGIKWISNYWL